MLHVDAEVVELRRERSAQPSVHHEQSIQGKGNNQVQYHADIDTSE